MQKRIFAAGLAAALLLSLSSCAAGGTDASSSGGQSGSAARVPEGARSLTLSDSGSALDGAPLAGTGAATVSNDIVYYRDGTDDAYGEGTEADMHSAEEADAHTVVTIREAGTYFVSGSLSAGQLAVDLGEDARRDPDAVVTLILGGVDITCTVAPAVIFYNVYECDTAWVAYDEEETEDYALSPTDVDTSAAGARVVLADGSVNNISGSYVARIYKEGTTKKLHKYDGAFYSKMSMSIDGQTEGSGTLNIAAENEGLDSELHLTVNGGSINIQAQNDGINTNEDGVSVTTINGGALQINAGLGAEGDGIDSNGHIVINGGAVYAMASDRTPDGGLDADGEIILNGGYVAALGVRNDTVSASSGQLYMELSFASPLSAGARVELEGTDISFTLEKGAQSIILSSPELERDRPYALTVNGTAQEYTGNVSGGFGGGPGGGGQRPDGEQPPDLPDGQEPPDLPDDGQDRPHPPDGDQEPPKLLDGQDRPERPGGRFDGSESGEPSAQFTLTESVHAFSGIRDSE